ncbi:cysteine desulfurase mitochondrial-like [Senna tora]|uniref:Cysteine desulfurase mitochondrial-like n=1 Tax=Senna tora TaxID=362788 RepID=A0A834SP86_9FABA|nr:cysteine desulfurase mitochondrial-like [Senna tora]
MNMGNARDDVFWVDFRYEKIPRCYYMCGIFGHDETEWTTKKKAEDKGEEFIPRDLGSWLKAEINGKKIEWSGTKKQRGSKDDREDVHRVGTVKRVNTEGLLEKLARLSVKEKRTTFINPDSETLFVARDHSVAHGGKTMESDGVISEITRGGEDDKTPKVSGGNTGMGNKNANPDQEKTIMRVVKGGVTTWKRMAREKENFVPVEVIKKRMFHDLTNAMECLEEDVQEGGKKARQGEREDNTEGWRSISLSREGNHIAGKMEESLQELYSRSEDNIDMAHVRRTEKLLK